MIIPGNFDFSDTEVGEELWGYEVGNPFDNHTIVAFSENQTPEKVAALLIASLTDPTAHLLGMRTMTTGTELAPEGGSLLADDR